MPVTVLQVLMFSRRFLIKWWFYFGCLDGVVVVSLHGADTHNQAINGLVWFCGYARTPCGQFPSCFVLRCVGQCIEWSCISGIAQHDFCKEKPDDIQFHVFDVALVECEVYLMEATQIKFGVAGFAVESSVIAIRRRRIPQTSTPDPSLMLIPAGLIQRQRPKSLELCSLHTWRQKNTLDCNLIANSSPWCVDGGPIQVRCHHTTWTHFLEVFNGIKRSFFVLVARMRTTGNTHRTVDWKPLEIAHSVDDLWMGSIKWLSDWLIAY